jgi:hypothetical protein
MNFASVAEAASSRKVIVLQFANQGSAGLEKRLEETRREPQTWIIIC